MIFAIHSLPRPQHLFRIPHICTKKRNTNKKAWEVIMKLTEKKKPVSTVPKGVWESSRPLHEENREERSPSVDMQKNGYPVNQRNK